MGHTLDFTHFYICEERQKQQWLQTKVAKSSINTYITKSCKRDSSHYQVGTSSNQTYTHKRGTKPPPPPRESSALTMCCICY